jgi:hypothetical protein
VCYKIKNQNWIKDPLSGHIESKNRVSLEDALKQGLGERDNMNGAHKS